MRQIQNYGRRFPTQSLQPERRVRSGGPTAQPPPLGGSMTGRRSVETPIEDTFTKYLTDKGRVTPAKRARTELTPSASSSDSSAGVSARRPTRRTLRRPSHGPASSTATRSGSRTSTRRSSQTTHDTSRPPGTPLGPCSPTTPTSHRGVGGRTRRGTFPVTMPGSRTLKTRSQRTMVAGRATNRREPIHRDLITQFVDRRVSEAFDALGAIEVPHVDRGDPESETWRAKQRARFEAYQRCREQALVYVIAYTGLRGSEFLCAERGSRGTQQGFAGATCRSRTAVSRYFGRVASGRRRLSGARHCATTSVRRGAGRAGVVAGVHDHPPALARFARH